MTSELQDAGINGEVKLLPAPPNFVGHWMRVEEVVNQPRPCVLTPPARSSCEQQATEYRRRNPRAKATVLEARLSGQDLVEATQLGGDSLRIRADAISKLSGSHLVFYLGRARADGEQPQDAPPGD
jgi:hypothetical protein